MSVWLLFFIVTAISNVRSSADDDDFEEFVNPDEVYPTEKKDSDGTADFGKKAEPNIRSAKENRVNVETDSVEISIDDYDEFDGQSPEINFKPEPGFEPDDEEFEGYVKPSPDSFIGEDGASSLVTNKPELKIAKAPHHVFRSLDCYTLELFLLALIFFYLVNFLVGRNTNSRLANAWFAAHKELFESNFSLVGDDGKAEPGPSCLRKESESLYSLWCSGRVCCEGMLVELRLLKRQDFFSVLINWLKPSHDNLVVKVIMDESDMDGFILAVGAKKALAGLVKEHFDLATYSQDRRGQRFSGIPDPLLILSEIPEATNAILNQTVCKIISDHQKSIEYLYFSDQYCGPKQPNEDLKPPKKPDDTQKVLIFSFIVGNRGVTSPEDMSSIKPLFNFIFYVMEKVRHLRLTKESKVKSERARQRVNETVLKSVQAERQEAAQNRRDEQRRATKERIMAEEDPEKARKLEEREQKKDNKRRQPRMKMMKVKGM